MITVGLMLVVTLVVVGFIIGLQKWSARIPTYTPGMAPLEEDEREEDEEKREFDDPRTKRVFFSIFIVMAVIVSALGFGIWFIGQMIPTTETVQIEQSIPRLLTKALIVLLLTVALMKVQVNDTRKWWVVATLVIVGIYAINLMDSTLARFELSKYDEWTWLLFPLYLYLMYLKIRGPGEGSKKEAGAAKTVEEKKKGGESKSSAFVTFSYHTMRMLIGGILIAFTLTAFFAITGNLDKAKSASMEATLDTAIWFCDLDPFLLGFLCPEPTKQQ